MISDEPDSSFRAECTRDMNLLSDLSSDLAVAILVEKEYAEKVNSNEALDLIDKVCDILQPISSERESVKNLPATDEFKAVSH
jgi:hypothetical protein